MYSMSTIKIFAAGCLALLILSGSASASLGVISLEELTCKAELIVHGSVASVEHVVAERETSMGKLSISTAVVHIDPDRILKGAASKPIVVKAVENMEDPFPDTKRGGFKFLRFRTDSGEVRREGWSSNSRAGPGRAVHGKGGRTDPHPRHRLSTVFQYRYSKQDQSEYHVCRSARGE
jgi:hypothetical protein